MTTTKTLTVNDMLSIANRMEKLSKPRTLDPLEHALFNEMQKSLSPAERSIDLQLTPMGALAASIYRQADRLEQFAIANAAVASEAMAVAESLLMALARFEQSQEAITAELPRTLPRGEY